MRHRRRLIAAALALLALAGAAGYVALTGRPEATPIADFSAPFVFGRFDVPAGNPLTEEAFVLGRRLFYDPRLSGNNDTSCATCHRQELAFTDGLARAVGTSGRELPFSSMSLVNLLWGPQKFFWDGRAVSLEDQALQPIQHPDEMDQDLDELMRELGTIDEYRRFYRAAYGKISTENTAKALATFMRALVSAESKYDRYLRGEVSLSAQEEHGRKLFMAHPDAKQSLRGGNCIDCHSQFHTAGFSTGVDGFSNNGLDSDDDLPDGLMAVTGDPAHHGFFKVPTLRNIAVTGPYMHDGRFETLEQVMDHYNDGVVASRTLDPLIFEADNRAEEATGRVSERIGLDLTAEETAAIIAFLHTLTDDRFLDDPRFANPFEAAP